MAVYGTDDAIYGTGTYGSASYDVVQPEVAITGVSATGSIAPVAINGFEIDISEPLESVSAAGQVGSLTVTGAANVVPAVAISTGSVGTLSVNLSEVLDSVSATGATGVPKPNVDEPVSGVSATGVINGAGLDIRSINRVPVTQNGLTGTINTLTVNLVKPVSGVSATGFVNTLSENPSESLASVSATGSIGTLTVTATSNFTLTGVSATGLVNTVSENPAEALGSVSATGAIGSVRVLVVEKITAVDGTSALGTLTTTGVTTVFDPDNFSRARAIRLVEIQSSRRAA
jgi:hypothetical protein